MKKFFPYITIVSVLLLSGFLVQPLLSKKSIASTPTNEEVKAKLQRLSIPFTANLGQTDKQVKFYANTFGGAVFVTEKGEIVYSLPKIKGEEVVSNAVIKEKLLNAKIQSVTGEERSTAVVNYFKGNDKAQWKKNLPTYNIVSLGEVYTGVDLKLKAYGNNIEKLFYVRPQADPASIAMNVEGAKQLKVNKQGELEVRTAAGTVKFTKPVAYQNINNKRVEIPVTYHVSNSALRTPHSARAYGFTVSAYDKTRELVIDPLIASTYLGGTDTEGSFSAHVFATSIVVSPANGKIFVAGFTDSTDFPVPFSPYQPNQPGRDGFISRFDTGLTNLEASTYLGGSGEDVITAMALNASGDVYVAGYTNSAYFPTVSPYKATLGGGYDVFVSKLTSNLSNLTASTYLGGTGDDHAYALIVDTAAVYVAGKTVSTDFPFTSIQNANGGASDGFVAKFSTTLGTLTAAKYIGGAGDDSINAMAITGSSIYIAGDTTSNNFPTVSGSYNTTPQGGTDAFIAKLDSTLNASSLLASTYLGGTGDDIAYAIAIDTTGNIFVAGDTTSSNFPIPASYTPYQRVKSGSTDAFASKFDSTLANLIASSYLGGTGDDHAYSIAINGANVYVFGDTTSSNFPTTAGAYDTTYHSNSKTFISKFNNTISVLSASTYLGGSAWNFANAVAIDIFGNIYGAGITSSSDFPMTPTPYQSSNYGLAGTYDAFIAELDANLSPKAVTPDTTAPSTPTGLTATAASDTKVALLWTASTDDVAVMGYEVWRDNAPITIVAVTSYNDTGRTPSTTYTYKVKAIDTSNNGSAFSLPASATTLALGMTDTTAPSVPTGLTATAVSDVRINLAWSASTDDVGVAGYEVWLGTTKIATVTTTSYSDGGLSASTSYTYTVKAFDGALNTSLESNPATATTLAAAGGGGGGGGGGGCFIATAAYGSYMADDVMVLRQFRDKYLLTNAAGRAFVTTYYTWSPPVADYIAQHDTLRAVTRAALSPLVYGVKYPVVAIVMVFFLGIVGSMAFMRRKRISG